jgi:uncharacterized protein YecE (DUF72 family)
MAIHVGIGSWADDAYVGVLYGRGVPRGGRLRDYARSLAHVEVNATYYATPSPAVVQRWVKETPDGFTFSIKLHRAFAQSPQGAAAAGVLAPRLLDAVRPLIAAKRLTGFLLVLPPRFAPERHRLEELDRLIEVLAPHPLAVELRHRDWVEGKQRAATLACFRERKLVWVAVDMPAIAGSTLMPPIDEVTNPAQAYLRLHGRNPGYLEAKTASAGHHYLYSAAELAELANRVKTLAQRAREVYVIANNHAEDFAPKAALALKTMLAG